MLSTLVEGESRRSPQVYIDEARNVMKVLRRVRPIPRGDNGEILDGWTAHRAAGLVRLGMHENVKSVVVKTAAGEEIEAAVQGTVFINERRETLFVLADRNVMTQIFPTQHARKI